jgi:nitrogen fixation protein FixH
MKVLRALAISDRTIPALIIGFFFGLILLQGFFVFTAFRTFPGMVTDQPFQRGQQFNAILAESEAQAARGWAVAIRFDQPAGLEGPVIVTVRDREGRPVSGARVTVVAERLTRHAQAIPLTLTEAARGDYATALTLPIGGRWTFRAAVEQDEIRHREVLEIRVAAKGSAP